MSRDVGSQLSLADARTRLEGAVERLEALEPKLRAAHTLLSSARWRTELSTSPEALDAVIRSAPELARDLESARRLHVRSACPELAELFGRLVGTRDEIVSLARGHGAGGDTLDALLVAVRSRALSDLPRPLEEGEHTVATRMVNSLGWVRWMALGGALELTALFAHAPAHPLVEQVVTMGAGVLGFAAFVAGPSLKRRRVGRVILTTRRLIHEPWGEDPVDVPLAELPAGAVRTNATGTTVELTAPRKIRMTGVPHGQELATAIELERWLSGQDAAPPDAPPRWPALLVPSFAGSALSAPTLLLLSSGFAILPLSTASDVRYHLQSVLRGAPYVPIRVEALCRALQRLDPVQGERVLEALAEALSTPLVRERQVFRQRGYANRFGFDNGARVFWFEPQSYALAEQVRRLVDGWEQHELEPVFSVFDPV